MIVPYLIYAICVELHRATGSLGFLHRKDGKLCIPFKVIGMMDHHPCCLATLVGLTLLHAGSVPIRSEWDVHGSNGEKAKAPSTPCIIPVMGSKMPLQFSSMVQLVRC
jgi:hypothetical protein